MKIPVIYATKRDKTLTNIRNTVDWQVKQSREIPTFSMLSQKSKWIT